MRVLVGRDHPMANADGYCLTYRLIAAEASGRALVPEEVVHHVDEDPTNCALENLVVLTRSQHTRVHALIRKGMQPLLALEWIVGDVWGFPLMPHELPL